jgi:hypothetical protein
VRSTRWSIVVIPPILARTIHEAPTATADLAVLSGVLAIRDLDVLFRYAFGPESLRMPEFTAISTVSLRRFMNSPG